MLRASLVFVLAASACVQEPLKPAPLEGSVVAPSYETERPVLVRGTDAAPVELLDDVEESEETLAPLEPDHEGVLHGYLMTWGGMMLEDAVMCMVDRCSPANGRFVRIELPEGESDVWVVGKGTVRRHLQVVGGGSASITVPTVEEADELAGFFGLEREPGLGTLIQYVDSTWGVTPELSVEADGPYFLDGRGAPMLAAESVQQGYYVYFNVPPGLHAVDLPGCDEGEMFWGTPNDESIDLEMSEDAWLGLSHVDCIH